MRVFPLSNWTELDVWLYIQRERIPVVPLYFAAPRPVVCRGETLALQLGPAELEAHADGRFHLMPAHAFERLQSGSPVGKVDGDRGKRGPGNFGHLAE